VETPVYDFIRDYRASKSERCHTPGHKGSLNPRDITEIGGTAEVIAKSAANAAELFGAKATLYSCSGSTLAVFAMLAPFANKRVTTFRGIHRSFIDAAVLLGCEVDWVYSDLIEEIPAETAAVFVTSIDYYGRTADIESIAGTCRKACTPLLVDNAHGAYLAFTDAHPIKRGATMSADSAHKTLPALTGAAYLHFAKNCPDAYIEKAGAAMELMGTSSPSFLILESLDLCNRHLKFEKARAYRAFEAVANLKKDLLGSGYALIESDLLRVTVNAGDYGYDGVELARELRARGVTPELCDAGHVVLLFSTITDENSTNRVFNALRSIPKKKAAASKTAPIIKPQTAMPPREAVFAPSETVEAKRAVGRICAEIKTVTPPGIPLIMPGEIIPPEYAELVGVDTVTVVL